MKKLLAGLFLLGSVLAFAAGEKRVPIEKMELNQQTSMVYVQENKLHLQVQLKRNMPVESLKLQWNLKMEN